MQEIRDISKEDEALFRKMLVEYYRDGEDENTPLEIVDGFVSTIYQMILQKEIEGSFLWQEDFPVGFVLYFKDSCAHRFSVYPGRGTIMEIGITKSYRGLHLGEKLVQYAQEKLRAMGVKKMYLNAYGPATLFWERCGYVNSTIEAVNGLPIYIKDLACDVIDSTSP